MTSPSSPTPRKRGRGVLIAATIGVLTLSFVVGLLMLEGGVSFLLFARDVTSATAQRNNERPHVMHDTLLGWVNRRSFSAPSEYGAGVGLTTTPEGFRGTRTLA